MNIAPPLIRPTGICTTCRHAQSCAYLGREGQPIWHCEEFDDSGDAEVDITPPWSMPEPPVKRPVAAAVTPSMGICSNCELRTTCRLHVLPGGIWHCEEYR